MFIVFVVALPVREAVAVIVLTGVEEIVKVIGEVVIIFPKLIFNSKCYFSCCTISIKFTRCITYTIVYLCCTSNDGISPDI